MPLGRDRTGALAYWKYIPLDTGMTKAKIFNKLLKVDVGSLDSVGLLGATDIRGIHIICSFASTAELVLR